MALSVGSLGGLFVACSGSISPGYESEVDQVAAAGRGGSAAGPSGSAGSAGSAGSGARNTGGTGGRASATGGSGAAPAGGGGSASSGLCDAPGRIFNSDTCGGGANPGCHGDGSVNGDFAVDERALRNLVDEDSIFGGAACGRFIDSRNPEDSLLLTMTLGTQDATNCYPVSMPLGYPALSDDEEECIRDWLSQF